MSAIGFINPTLYAVGYNYTLGLNNTYGASLNDVTSGNNKCCAASSSASAICCTSGFTAVKGWYRVVLISFCLVNCLSVFLSFFLPFRL
jgi:hypothetical protein